ncbi:hypothetical protein BDQ17DRAFT_1353071, partial [Cyathus striatus]
MSPTFAITSITGGSSSSGSGSASASSSAGSASASTSASFTSTAPAPEDTTSVTTLITNPIPITVHHHWRSEQQRRTRLKHHFPCSFFSYSNQPLVELDIVFVILGSVGCCRVLCQCEHIRIRHRRGRSELNFHQWCPQLVPGPGSALRRDGLACSCACHL